MKQHKCVGWWYEATKEGCSVQMEIEQESS